MPSLNVLDPARMNAEERRAEIASLLALGLIRLRADPQSATPEREKPELGFGPPQRVTTNPAARVRNAVRAALQAQPKGV